MKNLRKGSSEIISMVLLIVIIGGLATAVAGSISKQTKVNTDSGLTQTTTKFQDTYNDISSEIN